MLDHLRVIHRHIRRALLEVAHRISPDPHHLHHQPVRFHNCLFRIVHESRLVRLPRLNEAIAILRGKWTEIQVLDARLSALQVRFRFPPVPVFMESPLIFRSELRSQMFAAAVL